MVLLVPVVLAQYTPETAQGVLGALRGTIAAGTEAGTIATTIASLFIPVINTIAVIAVVIAGSSLAFAQSDEQVNIARRTFVGSLVAILIVNSAWVIRDAFIGPGGAGIIQDPEGAAAFLGAEVVNIIDWVENTIAVIAVLMLIISGTRAVFSYGMEDQIPHLRFMLFSVIAGVTLIAFKVVFVESIVVTGEPSGIISGVIQITNALLAFIALAAVVVIVIAGIMMVMNIGNDEQYKKARDLIIRVAIGLLVIIMSLAIVNIFFG